MKQATYIDKNGNEFRALNIHKYDPSFWKQLNIDSSWTHYVRLCLVTNPHEYSFYFVRPHQLGGWQAISCCTDKQPIILRPKYQAQLELEFNATILQHTEEPQP